MFKHYPRIVLQILFRLEIFYPISCIVFGRS